MSERLVPYPLRAAKISIDFQPFGFWLKPDYVTVNAPHLRISVDAQFLARLF